MRFAKSLAVVSFIVVTSSALAAVNFDVVTGTGFVGKGDVQLAFGWNNQALQKNAAGVTFSYDVKDNYVAVCEWITEGKKETQVHEVAHKEKTKVNGTVAYDARVKNQITGFNLTGFGELTTVGTVPVFGEACPGNQGHAGTWTSVEKTDTTGGLFVNYGTDSVPLPNTPVL